MLYVYTHGYGRGLLCVCTLSTLTHHTLCTHAEYVQYTPSHDMCVCSVCTVHHVCVLCIMCMYSVLCVDTDVWIQCMTCVCVCAVCVLCMARAYEMYVQYMCV